ncbi:MAG: hypothetical protein ACO21D_07280, partial [Polynucleobacter sp.]
ISGGPPGISLTFNDIDLLPKNKPLSRQRVKSMNRTNKFFKEGKKIVITRRTARPKPKPRTSSDDVSRRTCFLISSLMR